MPEGMHVNDVSAFINRLLMVSCGGGIEGDYSVSESPFDHHKGGAAISLNEEVVAVTCMCSQPLANGGYERCNVFTLRWDINPHILNLDGWILYPINL